MSLYRRRLRLLLQSTAVSLTDVAGKLASKRQKDHPISIERQFITRGNWQTSVAAARPMRLHRAAVAALITQRVDNSIERLTSRHGLQFFSVITASICLLLHVLSRAASLCDGCVTYFGVTWVFFHIVKLFYFSAACDKNTLSGVVRAI